jgi:hypothetical protein
MSSKNIRGALAAQPARYRVNKDGTISTLPALTDFKQSKSYQEAAKNYPYTNIADAQNIVSRQQQANIKNLQDTYEKRLSDVTSRENTYNSLADQIAGLTGGGTRFAGGTPTFNEQTGQYMTTPAVQSLSANNNFGANDLSTRLNFQVSDDQILNDYNNSRLGTLRSIANSGNAQVAGITERLNSAQKLLDQLPAKDPRRVSSDVYVKQLKSDLSSVQSAIVEANSKIQDFKPITAGSPEAATQITSFREYLQLPEERATQQLRQIDPDSYRTAVGLGRQYRQMATQPLGDTTTAQTEELRNTIEQEALNQLRLGSTIGAEERRGYEQAIRGAQTARGNIFGLGPAVQEASQIGMAGEQRKLARYGAAQSFLGSGETTGAAAGRDLALRQGLEQNRLGAAAGFVAGGPSLYNLANQRTGQQQSAMQQYIQANQALPGQFGQAQSTASPFYQTVDQQIPVALTNAFNSLYRSQADYGASVYGTQVGAISRQPSGAQNFATIAGGVGDLAGAAGKFAGMGFLCWVAREVYGIDNPKWLQFREWMLTKASDNLRNFYIEYGERIAESIRNKPKIKAIIRKWMDGKIK